MPDLPPKHRPPQQPKRAHVPSKSWGKGRGGRPWRRKRDAVLARDKWLCQPCLRAGRYTQADEVDHIVSQADGGTDAFENLQAICCDCHKAKTAEDRLRPPTSDGSNCIGSDNMKQVKGGGEGKSPTSPVDTVTPSQFLTSTEFNSGQ